jgi:MFS family permease
MRAALGRPGPRSELMWITNRSAHKLRIQANFRLSATAALMPTIPASEPGVRLPTLHITALGCVSMLTAMSSAMIYGLLPVFMISVLGIGVASVGVIEGIAEAANSFVKIVSGAASDWLSRRKPLVVLGYTLSALIKTVFPVAETVSAVFVARVIDRMGKGIRDAPRDAFLTDITSRQIRGKSFGLRIAIAIAGFVVGPLIAISLMKLSGDNFRLVFWIALIPAYLSILLLVVAIKEAPSGHLALRPRFPIRRSDMAALPVAYWWVIAIAGLLSLARFSQAFLVLKVHAVGVDAAFVPVVLVMMHLIYSVSAYPFGILADHLDHRLQLGLGVAILIGADIVLASAATFWATALGAALWGLQMGVTQGLLSASVADTAPDHLRGTAFGLFEVAIGVGTFIASATVGALWAVAGPLLGFGFSALVGIGAAILLLLRPLPQSPGP